MSSAPPCAAKSSFESTYNMKSDDSTNLPGKEGFTQKELQNLLVDFSEIYKVKSLLEREYRLVYKAKEFDGAIEEYCRLFEIYAEVQTQSHWTSYFKRATQIIQAFGFIAIVATAVKFGWDTTDRHRKHIFENWDVVALNTDLAGKPVTVGRGRKEALEFLHDRGEVLSRVRAEQAVLSGLNLPGRAQLQDSNFQNASLFKAYLSGANLYNVEFQGANLQRANFKNSDLRYAHFQKSDLQEACLRYANLENANFEGANLENADFRDVKGLNLSEVKKGNKYKFAIFDENVSSQLGLPYQNLGEESNKGCRLTPRSRSWWENLFK